MNKINSDIKILIKLFCFQEEIIQKNNINYETPRNANKYDFNIILIQKQTITKYKDYFSYNTLYNFLKYKTNILDSIKENQIINHKKLDDSIISKIYHSIPKNYIEKIEKIDKKKLIDELSEEKEWKCKYIEYNVSNGQKLKIPYLDDFEIINIDLNQFLDEQNITFKILFLGKIIFGKQKIFAFINFNLSANIFQIGHFDEKGNFNVEYLFNQNDIGEADNFIQNLLTLGIDQLLTIVNSVHEINLNDKKIKCYRVEQNKENLVSFFYNDKLKALILLLIYEYENNLEEVYLINKKYLDAFNLDNIIKLIYENYKIKNISKNNLDDLLEFIDTIINTLYYNDKDKINNILNKINTNNIEYKANFEKIYFYKSNKKIYKDFFLVSKNISNYLQMIFKIKLIDSHISFISINNKDILIDKSQLIIFIGNLKKNTFSYNIDLILDFQHKNDFNQELKVLINIGFDKYCIQRLLFNEGIKKDFIFPIFSNDKIIGYAYLYNSTIKDYSKFKLIEYNSYLKNGVLNNIISLYLYYKQLKKINNKSFKQKYYLINEEFINNIKIEYEYKAVYDQLEIYYEQIVIDKNENIYTFIKLLPEDLIKTYSNKKINKKIYDNMIINIEPLLISINYYDYDKKQNSSLMIYDNFEIIEKNIFCLFVKKNVHEKNILASCILNNDKIIVNIPNNLNKKFVSLIGSFTNYYYTFNLEYIMVYNKEKDRNSHIDGIFLNLEDYLNNLNLTNNSSPIISDNNSIIGTIIKYIKDDSIDNKDNEKIMKLKLNFQSCPSIGLQNIGATCYMNSTLQCFCHIEKFVEFFKYNPQIINVKKNEKDKLSPSFKILIDNLWPNNLNPSSLNLRNIILQKNSKIKFQK